MEMSVIRMSALGPYVLYIFVCIKRIHSLSRIMLENELKKPMPCKL